MGILNSSITQIELNAREDKCLLSRTERKGLSIFGGVPFVNRNDKGEVLLSPSSIQTLHQVFLTNMFFCCYNQQVFDKYLANQIVYDLRIHDILKYTKTDVICI